MSRRKGEFEQGCTEARGASSGGVSRKGLLEEVLDLQRDWVCADGPEESVCLVKGGGKGFEEKGTGLRRV